MATNEEITQFRIERLENRLDKHEEVLENMSEVLTELKTSHTSMVAVNEQTNELLQQGFDLLKRLLMMFALAAVGGAGAINMM